MRGFGMKIIFQLCFVVLFAGPLRGADSVLKSRLEPHVQAAVKLAASPELVEAVVAQNRSRPESFPLMHEQKWKTLETTHPHIFAFKKNVVCKFLQKVRGRVISEAFVNDAEGYKVGFIEKPLHWNHRGKPKHDEPMTGKIWIGPVENDESSGTKQVQIGVPIWSEGHPIGSLIVGLSVFELVAHD